MSFEAWRRVPETGACSFCLMLATRGAVYRTARTAGEGNSYHRSCRCDAELETDFDRRTDVAIDPADANQVLKFRNTKTRRTYTYDLRRYNLRNPPMVPAQPAVKQAAREVIESVDQIPAIDPENLATAITRTNPMYDTGARDYTQNCTRAVVAGELRCRGYDVTAAPRPVGDKAFAISERVFDMNDARWSGVYDDDLNYIAQLFEERKQIARSTRSSLAASGVELQESKLESYLRSMLDVVPRFWVQWKWKGSNTGHITMAEVRDGKLVILDPQTGQPDSYSRLEGRIHNISWLRVDNLDLTEAGALDYVIPGQ